MKKWMAQADPPKKPRSFERLDGWPQLLSSNKIKQYVKR